MYEAVGEWSYVTVLALVRTFVFVYLQLLTQLARLGVVTSHKQVGSGR